MNKKQKKQSISPPPKHKVVKPPPNQQKFQIQKVSTKKVLKNLLRQNSSEDDEPAKSPTHQQAEDELMQFEQEFEMQQLSNQEAADDNQSQDERQISDKVKKKPAKASRSKINP